MYDLTSKILRGHGRGIHIVGKGLLSGLQWTYHILPRRNIRLCSVITLCKVYPDAINNNNLTLIKKVIS